MAFSRLLKLGEKMAETKSPHQKLAGKFLHALNSNRYIKKRHKSFIKTVRQNNFFILQLSPSIPSFHQNTLIA
jgi:hypothetical protein